MLDPVIGRDEEIRRCIRVLCRRTKNNPVLIGDPGVGKTAIVEGLAQRVVSLPMLSLLASTRSPAAKCLFCHSRAIPVKMWLIPATQRSADGPSHPEECYTRS